MVQGPRWNIGDGGLSGRGARRAGAAAAARRRGYSALRRRNWRCVSSVSHRAAGPGGLTALRIA